MNLHQITDLAASRLGLRPEDAQDHLVAFERVLGAPEPSGGDPGPTRLGYVLDHPDRDEVLALTLEGRVLAVARPCALDGLVAAALAPC